MTIKGKVSEAQKAAQKKYDQEKTKVISIKYTPVDMEQYEDLKAYLNTTGDSANGVIKDLIFKFLQKRKQYSHSRIYDMKYRSASKLAEPQLYQPYVKIKPETLEYLHQNIRREGTDELLEEYRKIAEKDAIEFYTEKFNRFVEMRIKRFVRENPNYDKRGKAFEAIRLLSVYPPKI